MTSVTPRALLIEHDPYTLPGLVGRALVARGYALERRLVVPPDRFHSPDVAHDFPDPSEFDLIVPMGAPWSVDDHIRIGTWIEDELQMLRQAHAGGVPILGICFGGQALSVALGGGVKRAPGWEIGWGAIDSIDTSLVGNGPWFQFHQDAMVPPEGVEIIADNAWGIQAWTAKRTLAVQFHPELTAEVLQLWYDNGGTEVVSSQGMDPQALLAQTDAAHDGAAQRTADLVNAYLDRIATRD